MRDVVADAWAGDESWDMPKEYTSIGFGVVWGINMNEPTD